MKKEEKGKKKSFFDKLNDNASKLVKLDFIIMGILIVVYGALAFTNLGSTKVPQTYYHFVNEGNEATVELAADKQKVSKMRYYTGLEPGQFTLLISDDGSEYRLAKEFNTG